VSLEQGRKWGCGGWGQRSKSKAELLLSESESSGESIRTLLTSPQVQHLCSPEPLLVLLTPSAPASSFHVPGT
jgi:hypothetical protein